MIITGIYKITQESTGKVYVGSSVDIEKRIKTHFTMLKKNKHYNSKLQDAYSNDVDGIFTNEVLEVCTMKQMIDCENFWISSLNAVDCGFNIKRLSTNTGGSPNAKTIAKRMKNKKYEDALESFTEELYKLSLYKDITLNPDTFIGFHDLRLGLDNSTRLMKVGKMLNKMMEDIYSLPIGYYKISHVHFTGKEGNYMIRETKKDSSFSRKKTSNDIYDEIVSEVLYTLSYSTFGRKVLKHLKNSGIMLERNKIEKEIS